MTDAPISIGDAPPETIVPPPPEEWSGALGDALGLAGDARREALARVAAAYPRYLEAWARLSEYARDDIEAYAYARVGYHRGLDTLRAAGWRGSGYVRWHHESNRGFLRSLDALRRAAGSIGEEDEEDRCALFLRQLDPDWDRVSDL